MVGFAIVIVVLFLVLVISPTLGSLSGHPDNNIAANSMVTPAHIVPEWYFLWVYGMLRCVPNKVGGIVLVALVIIELVSLTLYSRNSMLKSSVLLSLITLT